MKPSSDYAGVSFLGCLEVVDLWLEKNSGGFEKTTNSGGYDKTKVSMQLMAFLAPARAVVEAWVVAKAD